MPNGFYVVGFEADEACDVAVQSAFDGFRVAFERGFAPPDAAILVCDFDKKPL